MPDITMCRDAECPRSGTCWRFKAKPCERQSYFMESPRGEENNCKYYWKMEEVE